MFLKEVIEQSLTSSKINTKSIKRWMPIWKKTTTKHRKVITKGQFLQYLKTTINYFPTLHVWCHDPVLPRLNCAALACPIGKQANLILKLLVTLSENTGHWESWLSANQSFLLPTLEALWILAPSRPSILAHKSEGNIKFANWSPYNESQEWTIQEIFEELGTKMEGDNPILLIYAPLHRYDGVKGRLQATHPKSLMLKSPIKPKDFLDKT